MSERKEMIWAIIGERLMRKYGWVLRGDSIFFSQRDPLPSDQNEPSEENQDARPGDYPEYPFKNLLQVHTTR